MSDNPSDDVKSRFAQRFENDEKEQTEQSSQKEKTVKNEQKSQPSETEKTSEKANIKQEWTNHSFYLPGDLTSDLGRQYKYLDLELDEEFGISIQKTRHYYPLIVKLGLQQLDELSSKETKEQLEELSVADI